MDIEENFLEIEIFVKRHGKVINEVETDLVIYASCLNSLVSTMLNWEVSIQTNSFTETRKDLEYN